MARLPTLTATHLLTFELTNAHVNFLSIITVVITSQTGLLGKMAKISKVISVTSSGLPRKVLNKVTEGPFREHILSALHVSYTPTIPQITSLLAWVPKTTSLESDFVIQDLGELGHYLICLNQVHHV